MVTPILVTIISGRKKERKKEKGNRARITERKQGGCSKHFVFV
jgi:hypothetical protein